MTDDVSKRVTQIIAEQAMLDPEAINPETTLDDLGLDSLSLVEVVFASRKLSTSRSRSTPTNPRPRISTSRRWRIWSPA